MDADLRGARVENVELGGAQFRRVDLTDARFDDVDLTGVVMRDVDLCDVDISAHVSNLTINGVDVGPLIEAELDARYPLRSAMRPTRATGFVQAWDIVERLWAETVQRARGLSPEALHESVGGEWSFIETLRHLVFATDSWVNRAILGDPSPWDALGLPWGGMPDTPGVPNDGPPGARHRAGPSGRANVDGPIVCRGPDRRDAGGGDGARRGPGLATGAPLRGP
jgi:hypothetical protein